MSKSKFLWHPLPFATLLLLTLPSQPAFAKADDTTRFATSQVISLALDGKYDQALQLGVSIINLSKGTKYQKAVVMGFVSQLYYRINQSKQGDAITAECVRRYDYGSICGESSNRLIEKSRLFFATKAYYSTLREGGLSNKVDPLEASNLFKTSQVLGEVRRQSLVNYEARRQRLAATAPGRVQIAQEDAETSRLEEDAVNKLAEDRRDDLQRQYQRSADLAAAVSAINSQGQAMVEQIRAHGSGSNTSIYSRRSPEPPPITYQRSGNDPNFPSASPQTSTAAVFGPLPPDMGTPAQRQFWASRCQNIANDGGGAAQGCNQTLQAMGISPSSQPSSVSSGQNTGGMAYSPSQGSRAQSSTTGSQANQVAAFDGTRCVAFSQGTFTNRCSVAVWVTFCVVGGDGSSWTLCNKQSFGATNPLSPDGSDAGPRGQGITVHWRACEYPAGYMKNVWDGGTMIGNCRK